MNMVLRKNRLSITNYCLSVLILLIGVIGVCYAKWNEELIIIGSISTGCLNIDLDLLNVDCGEAECEIISDKRDGGSLHVLIENAVPGSEATIHFEVYNPGTVPVTYQISNTSESPADELIVTLESGGYLRPGDSKKDAIKIFIPELKDGESASEYTFKFELIFSQS